MRLTLCSVRTVLAGVSLWAVLGAQAYAVNIPYSGWQSDEFTPNAALSNLGSDSPVLGNGGANSAKENAIYATFSQVDLNVGDKISFSGTFVTEGSETINSNTGGLRIGLFKDVTTTNENPSAVPNTGWLGYFVRTVSTSGNTILQGRTETTMAAPLAGSGATGIGSSVVPTGAFANDGAYTFELVIERTASDILLSGTFAGGYSVSVSQASPSTAPMTVLNTTSFDRIAIYSTSGWASGTDIARISFSDLAVTYTPIPEPNAIALMCLGVTSLGWVTLRKRHTAR